MYGAMVAAVQWSAFGTLCLHVLLNARMSSTGEVVQARDRMTRGFIRLMAQRCRASMLAGNRRLAEVVDCNPQIWHASRK